MSAVDILARYALSRMDASHVHEVVAIERLSSTNPWAEDSFLHEIEQNVFSRPRVAMSLDAPCAVVGYCVSWIVFEEMHIQNVAVHPRHRRVGLARHMLQSALEEGVQAGANSVHLEVRRGNSAAVRLYEALGFQRRGERNNYYSRPREDAILFRKELT